MPEYRREYVPGGTYFFTVCTHQRRPVLTRRSVREAITSASVIVRRKYPFRIDAWVILPDHLHCLWTMPAKDADFSKRWSMVKRIVTQTCGAICCDYDTSRSIRLEGRIWQRRFWDHLIRSEKDYQTHVDYVHWNPVKHGYTRSAAGWPYSSFSRFVAKGVYEADWGISDPAFQGLEFGE